MKKYTRFFSLLMLFTLLFEVFGPVGSTVVYAENVSDISSEVVVTDEGIFVNGEFYSQETFEKLLESAPYVETEYDLPDSNTTYNLHYPSSSLAVTTLAANAGELGGFLVGTWMIPGIGKVVVTAVGTVIIAGAVIKAGTWAFNTVKTFFADKAYKKAKDGGTKTKNHSASTARSLPTKGTPRSSRDQLINGKLKQRRYYDKNGAPDMDIDYTNHGNAKLHPKVPHRHDWIKGVRNTKGY